MKKTRAPIEVFSLSFLDVISCAFGAVVMLILLAKNGEEGDFSQSANVAQITDSIQSLSQAESSLQDLQAQLAAQRAKLQRAMNEGASNESKAEALETAVAKSQRDLQELTDKASGLERIKQQRERAAIRVGNADERDEEVGGIPVDSDYVVFIVDTSGSMKSMWGKVISSMEEVLNNHPQVKGFQVMSDNGEYLLPSSAGRWRKDTSAQRNGILRGMRSWSGSSNSSPAEGIETALRAYGKRTDSLALYVFGDDYSGGSYDVTLENINRLNTNKEGKKIARIHAIGFRRPQRQLSLDSVKFSTLMTEVARQNRGTFLSK
ncbi:hypothetical protein [Glaciecola petra]|uniref:VWA domain-containing protein n=1 Tax=Glaciecola petra TaxID=3075602 RepID=A0ABU2ZSY7_9ALTE|nr:hypothetical protein [Aestuariibacter sp. P117]MDT0595720.1 hypothetical protein [Aestuariibacter sp. P117]